MPNRVFRTAKKGREERPIRNVSSTPMSSHSEVLPSDGLIFAYMYPSDGTLSDILLKIGELVGETAKLRIEVELVSGKSELTENVKKGLNSIENSYEVRRGDSVKIYLEPQIPEKKRPTDESPTGPLAQNIWLSFNYIVEGGIVRE